MIEDKISLTNIYFDAEKYGEMQIYLPVCCQIAYFIVKLKERKSKKLLLVMWQLSGGKKK